MRRIILKTNVNASSEAFTSLKVLFTIYPEIAPHKAAIETALSRKKQPYKGEGYTIERLILKK